MSKKTASFLVVPNGESEADERMPLLKRHPSALNIYAKVPTYDLIHKIRTDLMTLIDTPLSSEHLSSPKVIFSLVRPLEEAYIGLNNVAILYCLLVNRMKFLSDASHYLSLHSVSATRANLCELLATNIINHLHERELGNEETSDDAIDGEALLHISRMLVAGFSPFQGAPNNIIEKLKDVKGDDWEDPNEEEDQDRCGKGNTLEMAIVSEAKIFIRSSPVQKVVESVWRGRIVYTPSSWLDLIPDHFKGQTIHLHDFSQSNLLDHQRLTVPRIRAQLELLHFLIVFGLWISVLHLREFQSINGVEIIFIIFLMGFSLDKVATVMEHGWAVYTANLWNGIDATLVGTFLVYFVLRIIGILNLRGSEKLSDAYNGLALDVQSCGAVLLFPRLAFMLLADNILILSLRAMIAQFAFLMLLAVWCFAGFLYAFYLLAQRQGADFSVGFIYKLMTWIWFGLDGSGIHLAPQFHPVFGPILFLLYSCLANTLLLTVLVSILSCTFSTITSDAVAESLYRRAVTTFEGIKSDAIFGYQPPLNLLALIVLSILRPFISPHAFHVTNVFCTRVCSAPILILIAFFERRVAANDRGAIVPKGSLQERIISNLNLTSSAHSDIDLVFKFEPGEIVRNTLEETEFQTSQSQEEGRGRIPTSPKLKRTSSTVKGAERASKVHPERGTEASTQPIAHRNTSPGPAAPRPPQTSSERMRRESFTASRQSFRNASPLARLFATPQSNSTELLEKRIENVEVSLNKIEDLIKMLGKVQGVDLDDLHQKGASKS